MTLAESKLNNIKYDFASGIVVTLVAIPLCLGIALASDVPLLSGILTGIIGGIVVGLLSQSSVSVSGPATGMIAVVISSISQLGGFEGFLMALCIAGVMQILIGALRAGFIADYIPSNVVQGLLCAIGILIIIKQIPFAFGYFPQADVLLESLKESQEEILLSNPLNDVFNHIHLGATLICLFSFLILIYWPKLTYWNLKAIPAPIVAVVASIFINDTFSYFFSALHLSNPEHLVNIPVIHQFSDIIHLFTFPDFTQLNNSKIYVVALTIAAVASLETLLNLEAAEKIDKQKRYSNRNREMFAQGIGNICSGLVGGLPITSVIIRSSINIQSGARSKLSTIFHGFLLLVSVILLPSLMNSIPLAALAAILIYTGYKLSSIQVYKSMYALGTVHFFPFIVTVVAIVITDLLQGILIGLATAFFFILKYNSQKCFDIVEENHPTGLVYRLILPQQTTFLNKAAFISELRALPKNSKIILDANHTDYIDYDIAEVLKDFIQGRALKKNISLNLIGVDGYYGLKDHTDFVIATTSDVQSSLSPSQVIDVLKDGNHRFVNNQPIHRDYKQQIAVTAKGQHPIAVVLGCIDSRVPVEVVFDLGLGDIFCARVAGNVADNNILGSIEFACQIAGAKLIIVMGHKECGAIKAACDDVELGHLTSLIRFIKPAIAAETLVKEERHGNNPEFVVNVTKINIKQTQQYLYENSDILRKLIDEGDVVLIGGLYDVKTGIVEFDAPWSAKSTISL